MVSAEDSSLTVQQKELVERILASLLFEKAARLRAFLQYVCTRAFEEPGSRITEEEVSSHVFARLRDGQSDDTIVRVHASQLRKRLESYFSGPGLNEDLILEIPKGSYSPVFRPRTKSNLHAALIEPVSIPEPSLVPRKAVLAVVTLVIAAAVAVGAIFYFSAARAREVARNSPEEPVEQFWSILLSRNRATDVILADGGLSLFSDLIHRPLSLAEYLRRDYNQYVDSLKERQPDLARLTTMMMTRQHTPLGDANLARRLANLTRSGRISMSFAYARDYSVRQFKTHNVILLGGKRANPWAELVDAQLNFEVAYDESHQLALINNRKAQRSEQPVYSVERGSDGSRVGYVVLGYLPNAGNDASVVYIGGTEMEGTEACGEWLMSKAGVLQLRQALGLKAKAASFPYFEVLFKTLVVGGVAPKLTMIAHRTGEPI
jgi:hypothetical protein